MGAGRIARKFAEGLKDSENGRLVAIGSRTRNKAETFADEFSVEHRFDSYEALVADADVDAVYVATPHPMHKDNSILCLNAGKAVLCEKPFTVNAAEAREVIEVARAKGTFLMEAMWTRFLPPIVRLREMLAANVIGEVRMVTADFGFRTGWDPAGRLLNPQLAGGGLLDVGIYTIALATMVLGRPVEVTGLAHIGDSGVDEQASMLLAFEGGALAILACAVRTNTPHEAAIVGTEGTIRLHRPWWSGSAMTLQVKGKDDELIDIPVDGNGYNYEADEVARCVAAGKTESDVVPLDETLGNIEIMDRLRGQWGLKYPFE
ncbi:MAG: Gfo/Idh/MocA family oxidoreductase [Planctomycetes bacterium]|nr:Gfo/Idh/MocA family oxidoreductase [Planctomycetota bacterium]